MELPGSREMSGARGRKGSSQRLLPGAQPVRRPAGVGAARDGPTKNIKTIGPRSKRSQGDDGWYARRHDFTDHYWFCSR